MNRTKTRPEHIILTSMIGLGWGAKTSSGMWQHSKEHIQKQLFDRKRPVYKPSNTKLDEHLANKIIIYYAPMFSAKNKTITFAIDTDLKINSDGEFRGDPDHVPLWNDELAKLISGVESFPSPGMIGSHTNCGLTAGRKYACLNVYQQNHIGRMKLTQLEKALDNYAKYKGFKLTKVEVKGTPALIDYHTETVKCGHLVALPRTMEHINYISDRMPVLTFAQLDALIAKLERFNKRFVKLEEKIINPVKKTISVCKQNNGGSPVTKIVEPESYGDLVLAILADPVRSRDGRYVCSAEDFSAFISVIKGIADADIANHGSVQHMAFSRLEAVWNAVHKSGDINVRFCRRKVTAMRDALSKAGFIQWTDHEYAAGKACVWQVSAVFFQMFAMFKTSENTHTPACSVNTGDSKHYQPVFVGDRCPNVVRSMAWMNLEEAVHGIVCC